MNNKYKKIKVCSFDVDGTLTNGLYAVSNNGIVTKSFYTRDFYGIELLIKAGIKVIIITSSKDNVIEKRIERLKDGNMFWHKALISPNNQLMIMTGSRNKKSNLELLFQLNNTAYKDNQLTFENLAHMGDAENDLELLEVAGISACPLDAIEEIKEVNFRSTKKGGEGAVYEFCKYLLKMREK